MAFRYDTVILALSKRASGELLSQGEQSKLNDWFAHYHEQLDKTISLEEVIEMDTYCEDATAALEEFKAKYLNKETLTPRLEAQGKIVSLFTRRLRVAIAVFLAVTLSATGYLIWRHPKEKVIFFAPIAENVPYGASVPPSATLTLPGNISILLSSAKNGILAEEGNIRITKQDNGRISYSLIKTDGPEKNYFYGNTLTTPAGNQYTVILPDGTEATLNAGSSIHYTVPFSNEDRVVGISGEAYFKVATDEHRPFKVVTPRGSVVQALGTQFDVNAYSDEPATKVTLEEGAVKITSGSNNITLQPDQQAWIHQNDKITLSPEAHTSQALSWKEGSFDFSNIDFDEVRRQLARWYDVQFIYDESIAMKKITVTTPIPLSEKLTNILDWIGKEEGFTYRIDGKKVILTIHKRVTHAGLIPPYQPALKNTAATLAAR